MSAEIRHIHIDELMTHYAPLHRYSFYSSPPMDLSLYENQFALYEDCIMPGMFEGDICVATTVAIPMTQTIRGKTFPMGGVAGVTSDPMTRRKGYVKKLMLHLFREMKEAKMPVSMLYPFRESFYEKLGYTLFNHVKAVTFKTADMKPLFNMDLPGSVDYANQQDSWDIGREFIKDYQATQHGMGLFEDKSLDLLYGNDKLWLAIARDENGEVIGTMAYKITAFWGTFEVSRFFVKNSLARYLLLQFIAKHVDQVHDVAIKRIASSERPETWFSDLSMKIDPEIWLTAMGRIINVREIGGMKVGSGKVTIQVQDEFCPWNTGIFSFEAQNGELLISDGGDPDCTLSINALTALIYGTHDPQDFQWRGWGNPSEEAIQKMISLFPGESPYLQILF